MGGDHAPEEVVAGAVIAVREHQVRIVLTGEPARIRPILAEKGADRDIPIVPAEDTFGMDEGALASWRRPRSSVAVACQLIRRGQAAALVSAGPNRRGRGDRAAEAALQFLACCGPRSPSYCLPCQRRRCSSTQGRPPIQSRRCSSNSLILASHTPRSAHGIERPSVGLLTIGSEPGKGNNLARRTHELLTAAAQPPNGDPALSFAGNLEGGDLLSGRVDVIVADGFTGNVALKTLEGTARYTAQQIRSAMTGSAAARFGALLQRGRLRSLAARLDPDSQGGAALLGLHGTVVIAHGASTAKSIASACVLAARLAEAQVAERIKERLGPARTGFLRRS